MPDQKPDAENLEQIFEQAKTRRRWPWMLVLAAIGGAVLWATPRDADGPRFEIVALEERDLTASVSATGQLEPTLQVLVGSEISGIITEVLVDGNDRVTTGQVLARIDTTKLEQQTERSRATWQSALAQLEQAKATLEEAEAQLSRFEEVARLSGGKVPSRAEMDAAKASALRAQASALAAEAAVAEAEAATRSHETDLRKSVIRSPIDGIVLERNIDPGQTVAATFQAPVLFTIGQDLSTMDLTVYVSEADIGRVQAGQIATFTVDAWPGQRFEATVQKVSFGSKTVDNVVSYETELAVPNGDNLLRPGMTATALIEVDERGSVLAAPTAALRFTPPDELLLAMANEQTAEGEAKKSKLRSGFSFLPQPPTHERRQSSDGKSLYVLRRGALVRVPVEVGLSDGRWTEVRSPDLQAGDEVVLDLLEIS